MDSQNVSKGISIYQAFILFEQLLCLQKQNKVAKSNKRARIFHFYQMAWLAIDYKKIIIFGYLPDLFMINLRYPNLRISSSNK